MRKFVLIFLLILVCSNSFAEETTIYESQHVRSKAYIMGNNIGSVRYYTESKQYHFIKVAPNFTIKDNPISFLLLLDERIESESLGDEVSESKIKLTAWPAREGKVGLKMWVIEHLGHKWEIKDDEILILSKGCCDNPDKVYHFDLITGKLKKDKKKGWF